LLSINHLLQIELKCILRSKFLKYLLLVNLIFIPFAFVIFETFSDGSLIVFYACIISAMPILGIGSLLFTKDGYFYQGFVTRNICLKLYTTAKIIIIIIYGFAFYLFLLPFILVYQQLVLQTFISSSLYYIGLGSFILLVYNSKETSKINLNISPFCNYEGISLFKIILIFPIVLPLCFWESTRYWGLIIMFILGVIGLFMYNIFIKLMVNNLVRKKYKYLY